MRKSRASEKRAGEFLATANAFGRYPVNPLTGFR